MNLSYVHGVGDHAAARGHHRRRPEPGGRRWGERDALVACHQQLRYSYRELRDEADRAARALIALGVQRGDRVGIWSGNRAEWMITQYAAAKAGAILVNINPAYRLRELEYALSHSGVSVLITARGFRSTDYVEMLLGLVPELTATRDRANLARTVARASPRHVSRLRCGTWRDRLGRFPGSRESNRARRELEARETTLQFDDPVNIQYTSGTTGSPKGATLSHHNILNNGYFVGEVLRYTEHDRICLPVPFYHCFGCVLGNMAAVTHGCAVVIPGESFDPDATLRAIEAEALHVHLRRADDVHRAAGPSPRSAASSSTTLRTGIMAGRSMSDRRHAPGHRPHARAAGHDLLRHD